MKKFMLFFAGLSLMVGPLALGSCSDDLDDGGQPLMNAMVTVKPNADNTEVTLQLDDYTVIHPDNLQKSPFGTKEVRARACLDYKNDDQHVDVVWLDSVLIRQRPDKYLKRLDHGGRGRLPHPSLCYRLRKRVPAQAEPGAPGRCEHPLLLHPLPRCTGRFHGFGTGRYSGLQTLRLASPTRDRPTGAYYPGMEHSPGHPEC